MRKNYKLYGALLCLAVILCVFINVNCKKASDNNEIIVDPEIPLGDGFIAIESGEKQEPTDPPIIKNNDFIRTSGTKYIDSHGQDFIIKGMGVENTWAENNNYTVDEKGLEEIASLGFNTIHVWLRYYDFVNENGEFEGVGWNYLQETVTCAKKNHLRIILKMETWPGCPENPSRIWTSNKDQDDLIEFWNKIASIYFNEDTIIGYSCINEPSLPNITDIIRTYNLFLVNLTNSIRDHDTNHIIFVENVRSAYDTNNSFELPRDDNIALEFHMYAPLNFTFQPTQYGPLISIYPSHANYPNENQVFLVGDQANIYSFDGKYSNKDNPMMYNFEKGGWQELHYGYLDASTADAITWSVRGDYLGKDGSLLVDDVIIRLYDSNMVEKRKVSITFDNPMKPFAAGWEHTNATYCNTDGYSNIGCIKLSGTDGIISMTADRANQYVKLADDEVYASVSAEVKFENYNDKTDGYANITGIKCPEIYALNKDYLNYYIMEKVDFSNKLGIPSYMGEFGAAFTAFSENRGGDRYISDILDICSENNVSFSYHCYWNCIFGLYYINVREDETPNLRNVFLQKLSE